MEKEVDGEDEMDFQDGVELPPPISFDLDAEDIKIAPSLRSFFVSDSVRQEVLDFWGKYIALCDSSNRQALVDAYHDQAKFSLTCGYPANQSAATGNKLGAYNLNRADDAHHLLHQGKVPIVDFLMGKLPATQHDPACLIIDVSGLSTHWMVLRVRGVFKEREERSFYRDFVIMPLNGGYCIINELFVYNIPTVHGYNDENAMICNEELFVYNIPSVQGYNDENAMICDEDLFGTVASTQQIKASFKAPDPTPSSSPNPHAHVVTSSIGITTTVGVEVVILLVTSPVAQVANPAVRQERIAAFAVQSGMNLDWSVKCLEEHGWDFEKAALVFTELNKAGKIPSDAFVK